MAISTRWSRSPVTRPAQSPSIVRAPFEFETELGEELDGVIEGFHHDADVVHPLKRHAAILAVRKVRPFGRCTRDQTSVPLVAPMSGKYA